MKAIILLVPLASWALALWLTNRGDPERALLSERNGKLLLLLGVALAFAGWLFGWGFIDDKFFTKDMKYHYGLLGLLLSLYGINGRNYRLVPIRR